MGTEFAFLVLFFIFLGYFGGSKISETAAMIGMVLGAFAGLILGVFQLVRQVG